MAVQERNYWLTTTEFPRTEVHPLPDRVEVAVIGAGFTGLSAARTLAQRGAKVAVLESETIGWGASSRNGGMVLTGMKLGVNQLISMYGRELTRRMYAASLRPSIASSRLSAKKPLTATSPVAAISKWPASRSISTITRGRRK